MKKSIFNIFVPITSQEQADRLKQVCLDNSLPIFNEENAFDCSTFDDFSYFACETHLPEPCFGVWFAHYENEIENFTQATEQEFMELLKQWKDENN